MSTPSNTERSKAFRERMYAAGYKVRLIWVKREKSKSDVKLTRRDFLGRLGELTEELSDKQMSALYGEMLRVAKDKQEAVNKKQK
jgi:hypothetical protein